MEILLEIPNVAEDPSAQGEDQEPSTSPLHPLAGAAGHKSLPNFPRSNSSIVDESEIGEELGKLWGTFLKGVDAFDFCCSCSYIQNTHVHLQVCETRHCG